LRLRTKNNSLFLLAAICLLASLALAPKPAMAYNFYAPVLIDNNGIVCPNTTAINNNGTVKANFGLMRRVMPCIRESIVYAANQFIFPMMQLVSGAVSAACILAIVIWGWGMATGKRSAPRRDMAILALKLAFVTMFTVDFASSYFGNTFGMFLDVMEDMLGITSQYITDYSYLANNLDCPFIGNDPNVLKVWDTADCAIETLVGGIFSGVSLQYGVIGFLFACMFTNAIGVFMALMGFYIVIQVLRALANSLFIFISAYIGFSLAMIISPLFIPCILFSATKQYFDRWLQHSIRYMLQPIILFAWLSVLMAAMDSVIFVGPNSVFRAIAGKNVDDICMDTGVENSGASAENTCGFTIGEWLEEIGAFGRKDALATGVRINENAFKTIDYVLGQKAVDTGLNGEVKGIVNTSLVDWQNGALESLGISRKKLNLAKMNLVTSGIDFPWLALQSKAITQSQYDNYIANGPSLTAPDPVQNYVTRIIFSLFMAAVVIYIFTGMLDQIPFVAAGVSGSNMVGNPMSALGKIGGPAGNIMSTIRQNMASSGMTS